MLPGMGHLEARSETHCVTSFLHPSIKTSKYIYTRAYGPTQSNRKTPRIYNAGCLAISSDLPFHQLSCGLWGIWLQAIKFSCNSHKHRLKNIARAGSYTFPKHARAGCCLAVLREVTVCPSAQVHLLKVHYNRLSFDYFTRITVCL